MWELCNHALGMGLSKFPGQGISNITWTLARLSLQHHDFLEVSGAAGAVAKSSGQQWQCLDCAAAWTRRETDAEVHAHPPLHHQFFYLPLRRYTVHGPLCARGEGRVTLYWARHLLCALLATNNAGLCYASALTAAQLGCSLYCCHLSRGVYSDQAVPCMGWL